MRAAAVVSASSGRAVPSAARRDGPRGGARQIDGLAGINPDDGSVNYIVATFVNRWWWI
jgi:hypothetical protein